MAAPPAPQAPWKAPEDAPRDGREIIGYGPVIWDTYFETGTLSEPRKAIVRWVKDENFDPVLDEPHEDRSGWFPVNSTPYREQMDLLLWTDAPADPEITPLSA